MRILKWSLGVLGGLALVVLIAAWILTSLVDPVRYKARLEALVADRTGRPFVLQGGLALEWFPCLCLRMGAAHLDNPPGVTGPPLIAWRSGAVGAQLVPMLRGQLLVSRIQLRGARVYLHRSTAGRWNWEMSQRGGPADRDRKPGESPKPTPTALRIAGIDLRDGQLDIVDDLSAFRLSLSDWQLDVGEWQPDAPVTVHTSFIAREGVFPPSGVPLKLDAADVVVKQGAASLSVAAPAIALQIADALVAGSARFQTPLGSAAEATSASGTVTVALPSVRHLLNAFALTDISLPRDPSALGTLALKADWSLNGEAVAVEPLTFKLDDTIFNGSLHRTAAPGAWRFELTADRIDLERYTNIDTHKRKRPFEFPQAALKALQANGTLSFREATFGASRMKDIALRVETDHPSR